MVERRRSPRVSPPVEVVGMVKATVPARVVDLSAAGIQVEVASPLRPAVECNISLPTADGDLKVRALVLRCRASIMRQVGSGERGMVYRAGLAFLDLSPGQVEVLEDAIVEYSISEVSLVAEGDDGPEMPRPIKIQIDANNIGDAVSKEKKR